MAGEIRLQGKFFAAGSPVPKNAFLRQEEMPDSVALSLSAIRKVDVGDSQLPEEEFRFPRGPHMVLDGIDMEVRAGEIVALLGKSGSGKSTLLRLFAGLIAPTAGSIEHRGGADGHESGDVDGVPILRSAAMGDGPTECRAGSTGEGGSRR